MRCHVVLESRTRCTPPHCTPLHPTAPSPTTRLPGWAGPTPPAWGRGVRPHVPCPVDAPPKGVQTGAPSPGTPTSDSLGGLQVSCGKRHPRLVMSPRTRRWALRRAVGRVVGAWNSGCVGWGGAWDSECTGSRVRGAVGTQSRRCMGQWVQREGMHREGGGLSSGAGHSRDKHCWAQHSQSPQNGV